MMISSSQKVYLLLAASFMAGYEFNRIRSSSISQESVHQKSSDELTKLSDVILQGPAAQDDKQLLETLKERFLLPPSTLPYNLTAGEDHRGTYNKNSKGSSFAFISYYTKLLLSDEEKGFFVEAGALDGEIASNTLWLELELGWTGLLIEVDPFSFQYLLWTRRKAWMSNTCLSQFPFPQQPMFEFMAGKPGADKAWVYRASSRALDSPFVKLLDHWTKTADMKHQRSQCFPLASYLLSLNVGTVDFLSLDIQGHEWDVLSTLPTDKVKIRVITVEYLIVGENEEPQKGVKDNKFVEFMEKRGYHFVEMSHLSDYIFVLKDDPIFKNKIEGKVLKFH